MQYVLHKNDFTSEVRSQLPKLLQQLLNDERVFIATVNDWKQLQRLKQRLAPCSHKLSTDDCG